MSAGYVYIVTDGKFCKIGKANDVAKRVSQLQTGNSTELKTLGSIVCEDAILVEKQLHMLFKDKCVRREWFDVTVQDIVDAGFSVVEEDEPVSIKLYVDSTRLLSGVSSVGRQVAMALIASMESTSNTVTLDGRTKSQLCATLKIAPSTLTNNIQKLVHCSVIKRVDRSVVMVNPYLVSSTEWDNTLRLREVYTAIDKGQDDE